MKLPKTETVVRVLIPAAFRRLCVETAVVADFRNVGIASRLQAAVC